MHDLRQPVVRLVHIIADEAALVPAHILDSAVAVLLAPFASLILQGSSSLTATQIQSQPIERHDPAASPLIRGLMVVSPRIWYTRSSVSGKKQCDLSFIELSTTTTE